VSLKAEIHFKCSSDFFELHTEAASLARIHQVGGRWRRKKRNWFSHLGLTRRDLSSRGRLPLTKEGHCHRWRVMSTVKSQGEDVTRKREEEPHSSPQWAMRRTKQGFCNDP